ncbi:MAG: DMT family transporter [Pseudomonadota bacterium]
MLIALSVLWGGSYFFIEIALASLPPMTIVAARLMLASVALLAVLRLAGLPLPSRPQLWWALLCMGALNNVIPFTLIVWGQTHITSGLASILNGTAPLFTVVIAHAVTSDEKLTASRIVGVLLGLIGVAVMVGVSALRSLGVANLAQLAVLGAALSYACAGIYGRRFRAMGVGPLPSATGQVIASSLVMVPLAMAVDQPWALPGPVPLSALGAVLALALGSTALAYILYFHILQSAGPTNLILVTFLIPVTAILLGVAILGEQLRLQEALGMLLIGGGLAAIDGRPMRWLLQRLLH